MGLYEWGQITNPYWRMVINCSHMVTDGQLFHCDSNRGMDDHGTLIMVIHKA